ncbi:hypothetical protein BH20ACI3_BH20ACI3_14450 [soil metagenome]
MGGLVLASDDTPFRGVPLPREFVEDGVLRRRRRQREPGAHLHPEAEGLLDPMRPEALELDEFRWYQVPLSAEQRTAWTRSSSRVSGRKGSSRIDADSRIQRDETAARRASAAVISAECPHPIPGEETGLPLTLSICSKI